jgi:hypothetical protein
MAASLLLVNAATALYRRRRADTDFVVTSTTMAMRYNRRM